jgi:hypothetical protein
LILNFPLLSDKSIKAIDKERSKTEYIQILLKEIKNFPITEELKIKLKNEPSPKNFTDTQDIIKFKKS